MRRETGRVLRILGGSYQVQVPGDREGERRVLECTLRGRLKQGDDDRVAVGDRVEVEELEDGSCRISGRLPRRSRLSRRSVSRRREQVIAANVDQVAAVCSVAEPEPDFHLLDRLLVIAELNGLPAFLIANKRDLADEEVVRAAFRGTGYEVLPTSATEGTNLEELDRRLAGRTTVFAGASGVGKSSLLNALVVDLEQRVADVGKRKGRHTTVAAAMFPFRDDGFVVDTPGLQYLSLWEVAPADLSRAFPEFRPRLEECRFSDCRHLQEPGCAVKEAAETGEVLERRYRSYRALIEDAEGR